MYQSSSTLSSITRYTDTDKLWLQGNSDKPAQTLYKLWLTLTRGKRIEYLDNVLLVFLLCFFVCFRYIVNDHKMIHIPEKVIYFYVDLFAILDLFVRQFLWNSSWKTSLSGHKFRRSLLLKIKIFPPDFFWNKLVAQNQI